VSVGPARAAPLHPLFDSECSVLPTDIQDRNSNAIAMQYCNSNLSREMWTNHWLCQDSKIHLLEVLNRPTTDVNFWTACLSGSNGWLQPLKLYATNPGVKQLGGKTRTMWNRSALVEVLCGYQSQPLSLCSELLWFIQFFSGVSAARLIGIVTKQSFFQISMSR